MSADPLPPPTSFEPMALSDALRRALQDVGYTTPTPVQYSTFDLIAAGRDVIVQSKTGSGKTAAFAIPLLDRVVTSEPRVQALVLGPTRELALQVAGEFERLGKYKGIATTAVYGGASMTKQIDELQRGAQIVSGTPGRVLDHLRRGTLDVKGLRAICLDEADEMLSMGFAEELNAILEFIPKKRQGLLFSATMPDSIQRMARRHLTNPQLVALSSDNVAPSDITHYVYFVGTGSRTRELARILELEKPDGTIVFCNTKDETVSVASELNRLGVTADWLNSDRQQSERERVMGAFRAGELKFLVATDVAARGIDVSNVSHVINFGFPDSPESYVHRTGRTGRAGRRGTAVSLITPRDIGSLYMLRLTYGIRPVERTLPSVGEERTKREMDRVTMLREAFTEEPSDDAMSLAKRLLTHDDSERLVASLVGEFFAMATKQAVAQGLAAAASAPRAAPAPAPRSSRSAEPRRDREPPRPREDAPARPALAPAPAPAAPAPAAPAAAAAPAPRPAVPAASAPLELGPRLEGPRPPRRTDTRDGAPPAGDARPRDARPPRPVPAERPRRIDVPGEGPLDEDGPEIGMGELRLAVGRRDGVRAGDLARLIREKTGLERREVGNISMRDRFTLVSVRQEKLDAVIEALRETTWQDRPLAPERGKGVGLSVAPPRMPAGEAQTSSEPAPASPALATPRVPAIDKPNE